MPLSPPWECSGGSKESRPFLGGRRHGQAPWGLSAHYPPYPAPVPGSLSMSPGDHSHSTSYPQSTPILSLPFWDPSFKSPSSYLILSSPDTGQFGQPTVSSSLGAPGGWLRGSELSLGPRGGGRAITGGLGTESGSPIRSPFSGQRYPPRPRWNSPRPAAGPEAGWAPPPS